MKKKIISLALAVCVVCVCLLGTGCSFFEEVSAHALVAEAIENTKQLDSMACVMKMEMEMAMEGMTMSIPVTADMKASGLKGDKPTVSSTVSTTMLGETVEMELYQEGDWAYIRADGMEYKSNITEEESEYDYTDDVNAMLQDLPEDLLENIEAVKNEDGSASVTVAIPDERFAEIFEEFIDDVNADSGMLDVDVKIVDAVVKITVANDYISVYDMSFTMNMEVEGIATTTAVKASVEYKNPGESVTVTPMEGYADFEEFSLDDMLDMDNLLT